MEINEELEKISDEELLNAYSNNSMKMYIQSISIYPRLSVEEQKELFITGQKEKLVNCMLRLVVSIASKYQAKIQNLEMLDIIQEGNMGLLKAIEGYNPALGAFSTYAYPWIIRYINGAIQSKEKFIRKSAHMDELIKKYFRLMEISNAQGKNLKKEDIIEALGISKKRYNELINTISQNTISINQKVGDDNDTELENFIPDEKANYDNVIDEMVSHELKLLLKEVLKPLDYYIIYYRFLNDNKKSLDEIAQNLNVTRERVRQRQEKILNKIKPYLGENSILYKEAFKKIKLKGKIEKIKTEPLEPINIIKYVYLKDGLTFEEEFIYELELLGNYYYNDDDYKIMLGVDQKVLNNIKSSLVSKFTQKFKDKVAFKKYVDTMVKSYGSNIYILYSKDDKEMIDYKRLKNEYDNLSFEEIMAYYNDIGYELNKQEANLLQKYFGSEIIGVANLSEIEKDVNVAIFDYKHQSSQLPLKLLYQTYLENKSEFSPLHQLYMETYIFGLKSKKEFNQTYPNSRASHSKYYLIERLEKMYYQINDLFTNNFTKEKWLEIKARYADRFDEKATLALNSYFKTPDNFYSKEEIMQRFNLTTIGFDNIVKNTIAHANRLYIGLGRSLEIDKNVYLPYVKNAKYESTLENKNILLEFLENNKSYEEIAEEYGLTIKNVSDIITTSIRKYDFYRYHVSAVIDIPDEIIEAIISENKSKFNDNDIKIIYLRFKDFKTVLEISKQENITCLYINKVIRIFLDCYSNFKIRDINITLDDILEEINYQESESILSDKKKKFAALYYGLKCSFNPLGKKMAKEEIMTELNLSLREYYGAPRKIIKELKERKAGIRKPLFLFIPRQDLIKILNDIHLPITQKEKEIINYLFAINGYPYMNIEELAIKYNENVGSLRLLYYKSIVTIYKYLNKEIEGIVDYESDIVPILRYFCPPERAKLIDFYKNGLSIEQIRKKYGISLGSITNTFSRLRINVYEILHNERKKNFDFMYYESLTNDDELPYYSDKKIAKEAFNLYFGIDGEERMSCSQIELRLNSDYNAAALNRIIMNYMLAVCKYKDGITYKKEFTIEEIYNYFINHCHNMSHTRRKIYESYFRKANNPNVKLKLSNNIPYPILTDLLIDSNPKAFSIYNTNKNEVELILKNYGDKLNHRVKLRLMNLFDIKERNFMSGKDINHVYRLLNTLDRERKKLESNKLVLN